MHFKIIFVNLFSLLFFSKITFFLMYGTKTPDVKCFKFRFRVKVFRQYTIYLYIYSTYSYP